MLSKLEQKSDIFTQNPHFCNAIFIFLRKLIPFSA